MRDLRPPTSPAWARDHARLAILAVTVLAVGSLLLAGLVMLGSVPGVAATASAATSGSCGTDAFYRPPSPLPKGAPGTIIRWRVGCDYLLAGGEVAAPAKVWNVLYKSTNANRQPIAVSGTVLVPETAWSGPGPRPVVAYATGTQGWGDQCAPSRELQSGTYDENFAVENLLSQGWAVALTDYPGLGTPGEELYAVGTTEGFSVLDILKAAEHLRPAHLSARAPVAIEGYSQGGGAAAFAAEEQGWYARSLRLKGVALGGTPANLQAVAANLNGGPFFAFLGGAAIGFNAAYPQLHFGRYLNAAGRAAFASLSKMCQAQGLVTYAGKKIQDYTKGGINPLHLPAVRRALDENNAGKVAPSVPVLQYHGLADEVIPYAVEVALHKRWCALGARSDLVSFPGDHVATQVEAQVTVVQWITNRFEHLAAPSNC
ncbi:MAG TPA: lipase family protein [Acidimicrobiales bacterium]|nr:lipase family protein [Acidimicrobiales bacterium]